MLKKDLKILKVKYNNKHYDIYIEKLLFVLRILTDGAEIEISEANLLNMMNKFDLFDEIFLCEMSKM